MKAESAIMPNAPYEIDYDGEMAKITFYEDVQRKEIEEGKAEKWEYDMYRLEIINRDNLIANLDSNLGAWMQTARDAEYVRLADKIRKERDKLLAGSDWTQVVDVSLTAEEKEMWRVYRQALRDVPQQEGFPYEAIWPKLTI